MNGIKVQDMENIEIEDEISKIIRDVCNLVIQNKNTGFEYDVDVYITDDDTIRKINKEHREKDDSTDVLSFPHINSEMSKTDINPETGRIYLGEIIISKETTNKQAKEIGNTFEREIAFLCVHGLLHLFGMDHLKEAEEKEMILKQKKLIKKIEDEILISDEIIEEIIDNAEKAMNNSYSPYSNFKVGSCVLGEEKNIYSGANIENSSFGATICAERVAIFKALTEGENKIKMIAIASDSEDFIYPCGICRQVMSEFFNPWTKIVVTNRNMEYIVYRFEELMPMSFNEFERKG